MRTAPVLVFAPRPRRRTSLPVETQHRVDELIFLAPFLGAQNPNVVPDIVSQIRILMPNPPAFRVGKRPTRQKAAAAFDRSLARPPVAKR